MCSYILYTKCVCLYVQSVLNCLHKQLDNKVNCEMGATEAECSLSQPFANIIDMVYNRLRYWYNLLAVFRNAMACSDIHYDKLFEIEWRLFIYQQFVFEMGCIGLFELNYIIMLVVLICHTCYTICCTNTNDHLSNFSRKCRMFVTK